MRCTGSLRTPARPNRANSSGLCRACGQVKNLTKDGLVPAHSTPQAIDAYQEVIMSDNRAIRFTIAKLEGLPTHDIAMATPDHVYLPVRHITGASRVDDNATLLRVGESAIWTVEGNVDDIARDIWQEGTGYAR